MNFLRKMAGLFSRPVSIKDPATWPTRTDVDPIGDNSALAISAVYGCVNLYSGIIGALPMQVYRTKKDGSRESYSDHPLYRVLHDSPNADQTAFEFWEQLQTSIELRGNAYAVIDRIGGKIVGLTPLHPDTVTVSRNEAGVIVYSWVDGLRTFSGTSNDVLHIRGFGGNALGGASTLAIASRTLGFARTISDAAKNSFQNGMRPSGVLSTPAILKDGQRELVEDGLQRKFMGAMNAGRPMLLEGGFTWQQLSIKPEEAQMIESQGFTVEEICRFFGVPPFMIGHASSGSTSWPASLEGQIMLFQKTSLGKRAERIEQRVMKQLLSPEDRANGVVVEFNLEALLRADTAARYSAYSIGLMNGVFTINEVRRWENLPPVDGGDESRMQMQNVPITMQVPHVPVKPGGKAEG